MKTGERENKTPAGVGWSAWLGVWLKNTIAFRDALFLSVRMVYPRLPRWFLRMAVCNDVSVVSSDDLGDFTINRMHPLDILREYGVRGLVIRLGMPVLRGGYALRLTIPMYRWIKNNRASQSVRKCELEPMLAHTPNDPSSPTGADRRVERKGNDR